MEGSPVARGHPTTKRLTGSAVTHHRPEIDPEILPILEALRAASPPDLSEATLPAFRRMYGTGDLADCSVDLSQRGRISVEDVVAESDHRLRLLVLRPAEQAGRLPLLYFMHAGGMVMGDRTSNIDFVLPWVRDGLAVVVSVEYRLAPEHPDPSPIEDCYLGLRWAVENANKLGINAEQVIVAGLSAGGGLAAGLSVMARDRGFPAIACQMLLSPMLDDRLETPSSTMLDGHPLVSGSKELNWMWTALLSSRKGTTDVSPYAAPARTEELTGLPRAYVEVGTADAFRDETVDYAARLMRAGVTVDLHTWGGGIHTFEAVAPDAALSQAARFTREAFLRRLLNV